MQDHSPSPLALRIARILERKAKEELEAAVERTVWVFEDGDWVETPAGPPPLCPLHGTPGCACG